MLSIALSPPVPNLTGFDWVKTFRLFCYLVRLKLCGAKSRHTRGKKPMLQELDKSWAEYLGQCKKQN